MLEPGGPQKQLADEGQKQNQGSYWGPNAVNLVKLWTKRSRDENDTDEPAY